MYKILIVGDSFKHFEIPIKEYEKRLKKNIEIIKIKPIKKGTDKQIIDSETQELIKKLQNLKGFKIVLNPEGKSFNTKEFYDLIEQKKINFGNIIFVIGGALGIDYKKIKNFCDLELNLGKFTLPHILALVILLEQIYRIEMIKKGTSYNK